MSRRKTVYYAHFMGIYNTPQEKRDIATLKALGFDVLNPNDKHIQQEVNDYFEDPEADYMEMFEEIFFSRVRECEVFAFKALPDGRIPGGVAMELKVAIEEKKLIIELPSGMFSRSMGKEDTREYLRDIGER